MINCEPEKLEFEAMPEFVRDPLPQAIQKPAAEQAPQRHKVSVAERLADFMAEHKTQASQAMTFDDGLPKSAELEALWPGVQHDFLQPTKRNPSFYLSVGFASGAVVSLIVVWVFSALTHPTTAVGQANQSDAKKIVVAQGSQDTVSKVSRARIDSLSQASPHETTRSDGSELIVPAHSVYEVKNGDSMAAIALREYKRCSPRLVDAICRANGMRNADVLSLGQNITLPNYHTQPTQVASSGARLQ